MILDEDAYLAHYGILRKSGRYPWGSGGPETGSNRTFLEMIDGLRRQGMSEVDIAKGLKIKTSELRKAKTIARAAEKQAQIGQAQRLREHGLSNVAIGERMKINESSVRALLAPGQKDKADVLQATSNILKEQVESKTYVDVGIGVERHMGVSKEKLGTAVALLQGEGYTVHYVKVSQLGTGKQTSMKVLAAPNTTYTQVFKNRDQIKTVADYSDDGGRSYLGILPPLSISANRVHVRYANEGGTDADGVIYIRPGVADVSIGAARYAQVRIKVDETHYIKGMAMYKDGLPAGTDLVFNTSKNNTGNKKDALKPLVQDKEGVIDPDNPFGATVRQIGVKDTSGKLKKLTSAMNLVNEEGNWETWSKNLSSQILSKQSSVLAKTQLDMTHERRQRELDDIMSLTNAAVRKKLLLEFAEAADSSAVHLKAHQLPRQANHVILPVNSLKENGIYAPTFRNGERVVLIRHPHGGIFEIPELTVNNRNPEARKLLGTSAPDAVGIHHKVAKRLSGADFDGDHVLVIPNNSRKIKTEPALADLKGFDTVASYPAYSGMATMTPRVKGIQMGLVSNLITDMTIQRASNGELARAVRHSMVVIDAEKHNLNYKQSAIDNGIPQLMKKYQNRASGGASTLISKAGSELRVPNREPRSAAKGGPIDKKTGRKVFEPTGETFVTPKGKVVTKTFRSTKLAETHDAHTLSSGTPIEKIYAEHSNKLKELANKARLAAVHTKNTVYSPSAKTAYANEVASLQAKLNVALKNAPFERQAQVLANATVSQKRHANPDMEPAELKRIKGQALTEARIRTGAGKTRVQLTDSEWAAIQAGAVTNKTIKDILDNSDVTRIKELATPKVKVLMTSTKQRRALAMIASGYTQAEIADALGVSLTTLKVSLSE